MQLVAHTLRYLANRYLAAPHRSSLNTARANAAEAHAILQSDVVSRTMSTPIFSRG